MELKKRVAYERLWDIAEVLNVPIGELFVPADSDVSKTAYRGGRRPMGTEFYS